MLNIHHICIQTTKYIKSLEFYKSVLGFKLLKEDRNFNNREYNTWLELNGFMIELQTPKDNERKKLSKEGIEGIKHFCLCSDKFHEDYENIRSIGNVKFKSKNGNDIYEVEGNKLFKIISPEGTIIEIRNSIKP